ncbi:hypothetical protein Tco_0018973 [Tanacetum coccineum]
MSDVKGSSHHNNPGKKKMTPKEEQKLKEVIENEIEEDEVYELRNKMREIHQSINNNYKALTLVVEDIARVLLKFKNED